MFQVVLAEATAKLYSVLNSKSPSARPFVADRIAHLQIVQKMIVKFFVAPAVGPP